ncbi:MAG: putative toxin-antitoxin system toxin component, PIN family [Chitinophagaceae bacterium]|nr:putative toxin-antitoxin system toxin component, PIN family [Chitinophagaceae bacterium]
MLYFSPTEKITDCRDPKDNKFLELAVAANATCIITGDIDLLVLNPFRNIAILNAAVFVATF